MHEMAELPVCDCITVGKSWAVDPTGSGVILA